MAKIKYNVKGVERGNRDFEQPKPGLYTMEILEANLRDKKKDGTEVNDVELVLEVTEDNTDFVGSRVWGYIAFDGTADWKVGELVDALGLPETGTIDTALLPGKKLKVRVMGDSWNNEYRARMGRLAPLDGVATPATADADPDADAGPATDPDAAGGFNTVDVEGEALSDDPDYYNDWTDEDLAEVIPLMGETIATGRGARKKNVELLVQVAKEEMEGGDGEGDAPAQADTYDDESEWPLDALKEEVKKQNLAIQGRPNREKLIAALREAAAKDPFEDK